MTSPIEIEGAETSSALDKEPEPKGAGKKNETVQGRSPGRLMWLRFKRDRTGVVSAWIVLFFFVISAAAPLISKLYGKDPYEFYGQDDPTLLNEFNLPAGPNGGMSPEHWFGIDPNYGRDVFSYLLYGMRTSLYTALLATIGIVIVGVLIGLVSGYFGGKIDYWLGRLTDFMLALPSQLFMVAVMPVVVTVFVAPDEETPVYIRFLAILGVMWLLTWMSLSRLVRAVTLSLREREFVEAAKVAGASPWRIIRKELLPNLITPIIVQGTYLLPSTILSVAFLSFVGVGYQDPTPDWGLMFATGANIYEQDPTYMFFPGIAMVVFFVAFNLLGDSVRDAFDPKTGR
ncbi:ABC transporter permease [Streptomyces sp. NPDC058067]|uniref:ABC transporter permease n=1 Tax=Streptomyces antnestii TaxID=2494256 RepID=A0A3S3UAN4_9ACTN|nr:ABC transporter permease [Streptomyces sp. San01]RVU19538.1 ABC transporter permease [Streptomyces sp. San01]